MQSWCLVSHILLALLFQVWIFGSKTLNFFTFLFFFNPKMPCCCWFFFSPSPSFPCWTLRAGALCSTFGAEEHCCGCVWSRWPSAACCPLCAASVVPLPPAHLSALRCPAPRRGVFRSVVFVARVAARSHLAAVAMTLTRLTEEKAPACPAWAGAVVARLWRGVNRGDLPALSGPGGAVKGEARMPLRVRNNCSCLLWAGFENLQLPYSVNLTEFGVPTQQLICWKCKSPVSFSLAQVYGKSLVVPCLKQCSSPLVCDAGRQRGDPPAVDLRCSERTFRSCKGAHP